MIHKSKREVERNIVIQSKSNPKKFWSHVRSKLETKTGVAPLLQNKKDETSTKLDDKEKANFLRKPFASVFTKEPNAEVLVLDKKTEVNLPKIIITEEMSSMFWSYLGHFFTYTLIQTEKHIFHKKQSDFQHNHACAFFLYFLIKTPP